MNPARILIVEDEALVSLEISRIVEILGYQPVGRAASGEKALALAEEQQPDLVLMDIHLMGILDGIDTAREMRRQFGIPTIFLTAYSEDATLERAKLAEPYGYIIKPFSDRDLKSAIEIALHKHTADQEVQRMNRLFNVLSQVNQTIVYADSHEELFPPICRVMVEHGALDFAWIGRCDSGCSRIEVLSLFGEQVQLRNEAGQDVGISSEPWQTIGRTIHEGRPFVCNACSNGHCLYPSRKAPAGISRKSCASFPIRLQGEVWGAMNVCAPRDGFFQDRELALFNEVAADISFALDKIEGNARRRHLEWLAIRQNAVLSGINRIFQEALSSHSEEDLGKICLAAAREVTGSPMGFLGRINREGGAIADILASHPEKDSCKVPAADGHYHLFPTIRADGILQRVLSEGKGLFVNDSVSPSRSMKLPSGHPPLDTFLGVPLRREALNVGIVAMGNREGGYRPEDLEALEAMAPAMVEAFSRKQAETSLRESEERYRSLVETSFDWIWEVDAQGRYTYASSRVQEILGYRPEEILGRTPFELMPPEEALRVGAIFHGIASERRPFSLLENVNLHREGHQVVLETSGAPISGPSGEFLGYRGMDRDVTERKRIEQEKAQAEVQLRQAQKMEAIGHLAGGIAHDFNNILSAIIGYTEMALDEVPWDSSLGSDLKQVLSAGLRAKELVKQILTFSRQTERDPKPVEITYIVKEAVKMLRATLPSTIALTQRAKLSPQSRILADPTEIHQVIMNLCTNAAHAMRARGGSLDVELTEVSLRDEEPRPHPDLSPGDYIRLSVVDTGHGMSEDVAVQIFNPFFTTKQKGEGTGMGLSVVHGIVKNCNGAITVESNPGEGTTFCVYLPRITVDAGESAQGFQEASGGKGRILVVDDEKPIAVLAQRMLEKLGYSVTTTTNSREALEIVASNPYWFDLLITDYTMPRMTGLDLASEVKRIRPGMPVIVCSGHNEMINEKTAVTFDVDGFLSKPFEKQEMFRMVKTVLQGE